jgi:hypothetical protein
MPVFRFHKGSLEDSMKTCVMVKNKKELCEVIFNFNSVTNKPITDNDKLVISSSLSSPEQITISHYCFDKRIGWDTHIVLGYTGCSTRDPFIIGFLSDDLKD